MGEAKRRKALGLGSAKGNNWKSTKRLNLYFWLNEFMDLDPEFLAESRGIFMIDDDFDNDDLCEGDGLSFLGSILQSTNLSPDGAATRTHLASLIASAGCLFITGDEPTLEVVKFLSEAKGQAMVFKNPETKRKFEAMKETALLRGKN
jgi:hypothetical protein